MRDRSTVAEVSGLGEDAVQPARASLARQVARLPRWARLGLLALAFLVLWYGVVGGLRAGIAPDPLLRPPAELRPPGSSATLALLATLVEREVRDRAFVPTAGPLAPTALAGRTAAYQAQLVLDVSAVLASLRPQPSLTEAAAALSRPPTRGWPAGAGVRRSYLRAAAAVHAANRAGAAASDARLPLQALGQQLDARAREGERLRRSGGGSAALQHARARATAYVAAMTLRGLAEDHGAALRGSGQAARWAETLDALDEAAAAAPRFVSEADLLAAGYRLLIAAQGLRELSAGPPLPPDRPAATGG